MISSTYFVKGTYGRLIGSLGTFGTEGGLGGVNIILPVEEDSL